MKEIPLTQGKVALVDDDKFEELSRYNWCAAKNGRTFYAMRSTPRDENGKQKGIWMHHELLPGELKVDHRDGNGCNNQLDNLRFATNSQNAQNRQKCLGRSSKFKGVDWNKKTSLWRAFICKNGVRKFLGYFDSEENAAMAYDSSAVILHGEFARLNFPNEPHVLTGTRSYMIGHMEYKDGQSWRKKVEEELGCRGITLFNPYRKPFINNIPEDKKARTQLSKWMQAGKFEKVEGRMKQIRAYDLRCVDLSDFVIANIDPKTMSWGTQEEVVTTVREKKPLFLSVEGGKKKCPLWLLGMVPHKYVYDSIEDVIRALQKIDSGKIKLSSDRWKLLKPEYR